MNPFDVKKKALEAVKTFGREGMGEHLKKGYGPAGKPAIAIKIESTKVEPEMGETEDEMSEGEGGMAPEMLKKHEGLEEMSESGMAADMAEKSAAEKMGGEKPEITPELLEMLLAKLGK